MDVILDLCSPDEVHEAQSLLEVLASLVVLNAAKKDVRKLHHGVRDQSHGPPASCQEDFHL